MSSQKVISSWLHSQLFHTLSKIIKQTIYLKEKESRMHSSDRFILISDSSNILTSTELLFNFVYSNRTFELSSLLLVLNNKVRDTEMKIKGVLVDTNLEFSWTLCRHQSIAQNILGWISRRNLYNNQNLMLVG